MKYFLAFLTLALFATPAVAQTYITYDDGSVYTVPEGESVYVTKKRVFSLAKLNKQYRFSELAANTLRDGEDEPPVEEPPVDEPPAEGSHEWCKAHVPFATGFSFADQTFIRSCDTNNDYKYGCGDEQFDKSEDGEVCPGAS